MGFIYVWEYIVPPNNSEAFQRAYGPDGDWAQLFRRADSRDACTAGSSNTTNVVMITSTATISIIVKPRKWGR